MEIKRYRDAITVHMYQLKKLVAERDKLNNRIKQIDDYIVANANFLPLRERMAVLERLEAAGVEPLGFTDAVREVLKLNSRQWFTPTGVRDLLGGSGFDLNSYSNPLASIHTILKRLTEHQEVDKDVTAGEARYRWRAE